MNEYAHVAYPYTGILLCSEKEPVLDSPNSMDDSQRRADREKLDIKASVLGLHSQEALKQVAPVLGVRGRAEAGGWRLEGQEDRAGLAGQAYVMVLVVAHGCTGLLDLTELDTAP